MLRDIQPSIFGLHYPRLHQVEVEQEEEEEDYFKTMNQFVEEEHVVDPEKLYDVLEKNLQYQVYPP